jgi:hypothetical protein
LHPRSAGDLSLIPSAIESLGFRYAIVDQAGNPRPVNEGVFLYASSTGALMS